MFKSEKPDPTLEIVLFETTIDLFRFVVHGVALTFAHENELSARECRLVHQLSERVQQTNNVLVRTKTTDVKEITCIEAKANTDFLLDIGRDGGGLNSTPAPITATPSGLAGAVIEHVTKELRCEPA